MKKALRDVNTASWL